MNSRSRIALAAVAGEATSDFLAQIPERADTSSAAAVLRIRRPRVLQRVARGTRRAVGSSASSDQHPPRVATPTPRCSDRGRPRRLSQAADIWRHFQESDPLDQPGTVLGHRPALRLVNFAHARRVHVDAPELSRRPPGDAADTGTARETSAELTSRWPQPSNDHVQTSLGAAYLSPGAPAAAGTRLGHYNADSGAASG